MDEELFIFLSLTYINLAYKSYQKQQDVILYTAFPCSLNTESIIKSFITTYLLLLHFRYRTNKSYQKQQDVTLYVLSLQPQYEISYERIH